MGSGDIQDITSGVIAGPTGVIISRKSRGKNPIGKDIRELFDPKNPELPELPEEPERDAGREALLRQALIERIKRQSIRGGGIRATIRTSPRGVIDRVAQLPKRLTGV